MVTGFIFCGSVKGFRYPVRHCIDLLLITVFHKSCIIDMPQGMEHTIYRLYKWNSFCNQVTCRIFWESDQVLGWNIVTMLHHPSIHCKGIQVDSCSIRVGSLRERCDHLIDNTIARYRWFLVLLLVFPKVREPHPGITVVEIYETLFQRAQSSL